MIMVRRSITAIVAVLAVATSAYAGVIPASSLDAVCVQRSPVCEPACLHQIDVSNLVADSPSADGLDSWPVGRMPGADADVLHAAETKPLQVFTDDRSSLNLCLYVLMGLGLCRSVPLAKKLSLGILPDWYHSGGPFQIGGSHAIGPDLSVAAVVCFVQPDSPTGENTLRYHFADLVSLWRKSQFTPTALASRGPPFCSR
jgi:hypothetical protein